jgi:hypothetical protein
MQLIPTQNILGLYLDVDAGRIHVAQILYVRWKHKAQAVICMQYMALHADRSRVHKLY